MRVLFDHQIFSRQVVGGVSRSFVELAREFRNNPQFEVEVDISAKISNNIYLEDILQVQKIFPSKNTVFHRKIFSFINSIKNIEEIKSKKYDIFHPTYFDPYFVKYLNGMPFVLTIHDMIHEVYPKHRGLVDKTTEWKKYLANEANHIIAISENTKKDIIEILGIDQKKISVVHIASSLSSPESNPKSSTYTFPEKYILYVGQREGYKNFETLLKAFIQLGSQYDEFILFCVGGDFSKKEMQFISTNNLEKKVVNSRLSDSELISAYKNAEVFVYPSLYEGFGIPPLEAMENSCPVIASNASSIPEVCADAALYFEPSSVEDLKSQLVKILNNKKLKKEMTEKGRERSKAFSWKQSAEKLSVVYKNL